MIILSSNNWLISTWDELAIVVISCLLIYAVVIVVTRYTGLRTFAKMSSFDFAITIAFGSVIASTVLNSSQSVLQGTVILFTFATLQILFSIAKRRSKFFKNLTTNEPLLLMDGKTILYDNLEKVRVSESELIAKLREANVIQLSEVKAVIMETTGDISVLHGESDKDIDDLILKYVESK